MLDYVHYTLCAKTRLLIAQRQDSSICSCLQPGTILNQPIFDMAGQKDTLKYSFNTNVFKKRLWGGKKSPPTLLHSSGCSNNQINMR